MELTTQDSSRNLVAFMWHSAFLALTISLVEVNTVVPAMLLKLDASPFLLGLFTTITLGGASVAQVFFAGYLLGNPRKRGMLLLGINLRVAALFGLAVLFAVEERLDSAFTLALTFILITLFSLSGAFANVSYTDLLGKSVKREKRKAFFTSKQVFNSIGLLLSALVARGVLKTVEFPRNYFVLFALAGGLLLTASLGFWRLEECPGPRQGRSFSLFLRSIPGEIKANSNLKLYLGIMNTLGVGLAVSPFLVLYGKEHFRLTAEVVGNILFFLTAGILLAGLYLFRNAQKYTYKQLLYGALFLQVVTLVGAPLLQHWIFSYLLVFSFAGLFIATYKTAIGGFLLEISNSENRTIYAGIAGIGSIVPLIAPMVAGALLPRLSYPCLWAAALLVVGSSFFLIRRITCGPLS